MQRSRYTLGVAAVLGLGLVAAHAFAQVPADAAPESEPIPEVAGPRWVLGPTKAPIGEDLAEIDLPSGYRLLGAEDTQRVMEMNQNLVDGSELALITASEPDRGSWFLIFEWDDVGHVPDDEKDALDADAILKRLQEGQAAANREYAKRGWDEVTIVGWHQPPRYEPTSHNLTWAILGESKNGKSVNRLVKLLGRSGVMSATVVADPTDVETAVAEADELLGGYRFKAGSTYAEYVPGKDKLAKYGLTALIVGGAGAALVGTGALGGLVAVFGKLFAKMGKGIVLVIAAAGAALQRVAGAFRGKSRTSA